MTDSPAASEAPMNGLAGNLFRALAHRNYRLFFGGQGISLIGTWMTRVATSWLVYILTGQDWMLGIVSFAGQIPILAITSLAGVWVEDRNRLRVLVWTQAASMVQSFALAALALSNLIEIWQFIVLAVIQGVINAIDTPTRQAFLVEIVDDRRDLANAIALNSSMFNGARLIGPALAGALLAAFAAQAGQRAGAGYCFLIDGISYLAVIWALLQIKVKPRPFDGHKRRLWHELKEGFHYAFHYGPIRALLLLLALVSIVGAPFMVLMPAFAKAVYHGNAVTYGIMLAVSGVGALCGGLFLASRSSALGLGRVIALNSGLFGVSVILFALVRNVWLALPLVFAASYGLMVQMAASNTVLQTLVEDDKRARIMALYTMMVLGMVPIGSLFCSGLVAIIGPAWTVGAGGAISLVGTVLFASQLPKLRVAARPALERAGLLPPLAAGLQSATAAGEAAAA